MTSVTVSTEDLLQLLSAAKITAAQKADFGPLHAVLLSSARVEGEESGETDLLVATSTDGARASQVRIAASGQLLRPILLSLPSIGWLTSMVSTVSKSAKTADKESLCEVELSVSGERAHQRIRVVSLSDGVPGARADDPSALFDPSEFPINDALMLLNPSVPEKKLDASGMEIASGRLQAYDKAALGLLTKVAAQFGSVKRYCIGHPAGEQVITAGGCYRATITPVEYSADDDVNEPDVDIIDISLEDSDGEEASVDDTDYASMDAGDLGDEDDLDTDLLENSTLSVDEGFNGDLEFTESDEDSAELD